MRPEAPAARPRLAAALLATALLAPACSAMHHRVAADASARDVLDANRGKVPEARGSFDLDAARAAARPARLVHDVALTLDAALRLAATANRDALGRREDVFLAALALVGARHDFATTPAGALAAAGVRSGDGGTVSGHDEASLARALESGGSLVLRLAADFLRGLSTDPVTTAQSILSADLVLPLLRGSGTTVARESLTQAERDVVYALRSYARFQQDFAVRIAAAFLRTVQQRDTLANEDQTYESLKSVLERARSYGPEGAGRLPDFQVDQARQDLLRAEDRRVRARQGYDAALDRLAQELGVVVGSGVDVDPASLEALHAKGLVAPALGLEQALSTALTRRLDLRNARDQREDADRKVLVAKDALGAQVDLALGADLSTHAGRPLDVESARGTARAGLSADLPFDRTSERIAYRTAEIQADRARRAVEAFEDAVRAEVREAWRTLDQARQSYALQEEGVRLAKRRVESADLNLQAGKATTRDRLEAQDALIEAQNALTAALVDYVLARMAFERDTGTLVP